MQTRGFLLTNVSYNCPVCNRSLVGDVPFLVNNISDVIVGCLKENYYLKNDTCITQKKYITNAICPICGGTASEDEEILLYYNNEVCVGCEDCVEKNEKIWEEIAYDD